MNWNLGNGNGAMVANTNGVGRSVLNRKGQRGPFFIRVLEYYIFFSNSLSVLSNITSRARIHIINHFQPIQSITRKVWKIDLFSRIASTNLIGFIGRTYMSSQLSRDALYFAIVLEVCWKRKRCCFFACQSRILCNAHSINTHFTASNVIQFRCRCRPLMPIIICSVL